MYRKRLKNVYDLLEAGNNKKVIQEVDKLVASTAASIPKKKSVQGNTIEPPLPGYEENITLVIAKALKCLALFRTGKRVESEKLIDELLELKTTDENALSIIMQYCKETQQLSKIVTFYEVAADKVNQGTQEHEELLNSLFNAYVRNRDFTKQQQLALKLYKQTNKIIFCYWNAATYVLMSNSESVNEMQRGLYLQLAEKILQKIYIENKMEFDGEFLLYLNILESRSKFEEALKIVENFDNEKNLFKIGQPNFKFNKIILYYKQLKRWNLLRLKCEEYFLDNQQLAVSNLDDWNTYLAYFQSVINLINDNDCIDRIDLIDKVFEFLDNLIKKIETNDTETKLQGPYLARIEFINQMFNSNIKNFNITLHDDKLKTFFLNLINLYSSKPGFFFDIIPFNDLIEACNLKDYILSILRQQHEQNRPFKSIKSIYTCLSYWQIHSYFGEYSKMNEEELENLAFQFEQLYLEGLEFGKDLLETAFQYSDEFLLLAVHIRYNLIKRDYNKNQNNLLSLVLCLKYGLVHSPSNFQFKLLLLNLYSHLGAFDSMKKMYDSMEIKNIQNYSTANILLFHNFRLGSFESSVTTYSTIESFLTSGLFDMTSFMVNCYKYGTFLKLIEINSFLIEIKRSLSLNICFTNYMSIYFILDQFNPKESENEIDFTNDFKTLKERIDNYSKDILNCSTIYDQDGLIDLENELRIIDHTDRNILYNWQKSSDNTYNRMKANQIKLLKFRSLIIKYIDSCLTVWINENQNLEQSKFCVYKDQLLNFDYSFQEISDSELNIYDTKCNYLKRISEFDLSNLLNLIISLSSDLGNESEVFLESERENNQMKLSFYKTEIEKTITKIKYIKFNRENNDQILEYLSSSLEIISYVIIIFTACLSNKFLKPIWFEKCKKSKKKKGPYLKYSQSIDLIYEIYEIIARIINNLFLYSNDFVNNSYECLKNFKQPSFTKERKFECDLNDISVSYKKSFEELKKIFNSKLTYMSKFSSYSLTQILAFENLKI